MYSNNILNFQESTTISNACTKKSGNLLNWPRIQGYEIIVDKGNVILAMLKDYFRLNLKNTADFIERNEIDS